MCKQIVKLLNYFIVKNNDRSNLTSHWHPRVKVIGKGPTITIEDFEQLIFPMRWFYKSLIKFQFSTPWTNKYPCQNKC